MEKLSKQEMNNLIEEYRATGNEECKEAVILALQPMITKIVQKYRGFEMDYWDTFSTGNIGLMKAFNSFDISKNVSFSTYAHNVIERTIIKDIQKHTAKKRTAIVESLDDTNNILCENAVNKYDTIEDENVDLENDIPRQVDIQEALSLLDERELYVIEHKYGINDCEILNRPQIAKELECHKITVDRIEKTALIKMKWHLGDKYMEVM